MNDRRRVTDIVNAIRSAEDLYPFPRQPAPKGTLASLGDKEYWAYQWNISSRDAQDVMTLIDGEEGLGMSDLTDAQCKEFCMQIEEGLHSSLDGWEDTDRIVIELFIQDVLRLVSDGPHFKTFPHKEG